MPLAESTGHGQETVDKSISIAAGQKLGIEFDCNADGVLIQAADPSLPMGASGIKAGDVIVSINGTSTVGITKSTLVGIIQSSSQPDGSKALSICLVPNAHVNVEAQSVPVNVSAPAAKESSKASQSVSIASQPLAASIVTITVASGEKLGIEFECTAAGVTLSSVSPVSAMAKAGIKEGDIITQLNKRSTLGITCEMFADFVGSAAFPDGSKELHIALQPTRQVLVKADDKLGIDFECTSAGVILSSVQQTSALYQAGIRPGDAIVALNSTCVMDVTQSFFVQVVGNSSQADGSRRMNLGLACTARVEIPDQAKLGIDFECTANGVVLLSVQDGSPLAAAGLSAGCTLQSLNGFSLIPANQVTLVSLINAAPVSGEGIGAVKTLVFTYSQVLQGPSAGGSAVGSGQGWGRRKKPTATPTLDGNAVASHQEPGPSAKFMEMRDPKNQMLKVILNESSGFKMGMRYECHHDGVHVKEVESHSAAFEAHLEIGHCIVAMHADNRCILMEDADSLSL